MLRGFVCFRIISNGFLLSLVISVEFCTCLWRIKKSFNCPVISYDVVHACDNECDLF